MYVYIKSEPGLWTVGFYSPDGKWNPESDYDTKDEAADRVAWLNGSQKTVKLILPKELQLPSTDEEQKMCEHYCMENRQHLPFVWAGMIMMKEYIIKHLPKSQ